MTGDDSEVDEISFSKKVDTDGRLVIPKPHRRALGIDDEEAIVEFDASVLTVLDEEEQTAKDEKDRGKQNLSIIGPSAAVAWTTGKACTVSQKAIKSYVGAKHAALTLDSRHPYYPLSQMPLHRKGGLAVSNMIILAIIGGLMYWTGDFAAIARWDTTTLLGMVLGLLVGLALVDRNLPSVNEAEQQIR
ncbi:hypothetical protein [Natrialba hulunbeirensis]|uniref:hypothetical protein n=1 Tax=Natrialba hulunbeirensis TaxID=123783 RepID=UPI000677DA36|nr:hypothetical protein [Natrialba hulunbeirensis]